MSRISQLAALAAMALTVAAFTSCSDDDGNEGGNGNDRGGAFFISAQNEDGSAEYLLQVDDIDSGTIDIDKHFSGDLEKNGYTWIFDDDPSVAVGLIYNQGDPGVGLLYGVNSAGNMTQISSRDFSKEAISMFALVTHNRHIFP